MLIQYYDLPFFSLWLYLPFAYLIGIGLGLSLKTKSFKKTCGILALIAFFSTLAMIGLSGIVPAIFIFLIPILASILLTLGYFMGGGARAIYTDGKAKSKHPLIFVILAALFLFSPVFILSLANAYKNVDRKPETRVETNVQPIPDKLGYAYRVQMDLTLMETGEPITIDFMVRCKNTHKFSETNPKISGQVQFKALSTGAAVAASTPSEYCHQSLGNEPFDKLNSSRMMPVLMWYDDVNDLSEAWAYMTNDAYSSPLAKVRFVDYKISRATAGQFRKWMQETIQNYEQIGAIPGPLGCAPIRYTEPTSCSYRDYVKRNGGKPINVVSRGRSPHFTAIPFPTENFGDHRAGHIDFEIIKAELAPNSDYFCPQRNITVRKAKNELGKCLNKRRKCPVTKNVKGRDHPDVRSISELAEDFISTQYRYKHHLEFKSDRFRYLDPDCLKENRACNIRTVWPTISVQTDKGIVRRMLRKTEYQGFSILKNTAFTVEDFGSFDATGFRTPNGLADKGVLFVNEKLVCDSNASTSNFFDFKNKEFVTNSGRY